MDRIAQRISFEFRQNNSLILYIQHEKNITILKHQDPTSIFTFSWIGYSVNGENMSLQYGNLSNPVFDQFTFISPISSTETIISESSKEINHTAELPPIIYVYIALIVVGVGLILKTAELLYSPIRNMMKTEEDDYVNMRSTFKR